MVAVIVYSSAVVAALVAVDFGDGCLGRIIRPRDAVGGRCLTIGLALGLTDGGSFDIGFVDVASDPKVLISLRRGGSRGFVISVLALLSL